MKARVVNPTIELAAAPDQLSAEWMELTDVRLVKRNGRMIQRAFWKVGSVIEMPDCWMAVQMGWAEPADEECNLASGCMTREELDAAQKAYIKTNLGIHPEDYEKFDNGEILGYSPTGGYIPGPNFHQMKNEDSEDEE